MAHREVVAAVRPTVDASYTLWHDSGAVLRETMVRSLAPIPRTRSQVADRGLRKAVPWQEKEASMDRSLGSLRKMALLLVLAWCFQVIAAAIVACGEDEQKATTSPTPVGTTEATATPAETPTVQPTPTGRYLDAASATITVDGDASDWADIDGLSLTLQQFQIPPGSDIEYDPVDPRQATLKVATDSDNIYVLFQVADDFDFDPDDHNLSPSPNVMFRINQAASPHMGAEQPDFESSLGMVDIWHWELDCGPGELSGGVTGISGGDDPDCNLDDEYATTPEEREDDDSDRAENSLSGVWDHSARSQGSGADGTWIFEFSRPLVTADTNDVQFPSGGIAFMALAYFDPDESAAGWSEAGHVTSADGGWITVNLP